MDLVGETALYGGWKHWTFQGTLPASPEKEWLRVYSECGSQLSFDDVIIDTRSVPEPPALLLLAAAASGCLLCAWRRRRGASG